MLWRWPMGGSSSGSLRCVAFGHCSDETNLSVMKEVRTFKPLAAVSVKYVCISASIYRLHRSPSICPLDLRYPSSITFSFSASKSQQGTIPIHFFFRPHVSLRHENDRLAWANTSSSRVPDWGSKGPWRWRPGSSIGRRKLAPCILGIKEIHIRREHHFRYKRDTNPLRGHVVVVIH
jgi:hypothetical protein